MNQDTEFKHVIREETTFTSIREPIKELAPVKELLPRIENLKKACEGHVTGPLTLIFHFDTTVDGYDAEIGYPVIKVIEKDNVSTRTLPRLEFLSFIHHGSYDTLRQSYGKVYNYFRGNGLSDALELVLILHEYDFEDQKKCVTEVQASFLAWDNLYRENLDKILGDEKRKIIWAGGEKITPFTAIDERAAWVKKTLERLKEHSTANQQFEIISRLALPRPLDEIDTYKEKYEKTKDIQQLLKEREEKQKWRIKPKIEDNVIYMSKIPMSYAYGKRDAYDEAKTPAEIRKNYCFCTLIRNHEGETNIDPIFCYRAAGWERQLWERVLGKKVIKSEMLKSVLKGDDYCQFSLHFSTI
ncbi:MAG: GyrI-like domain-containing protein [Candidatus Hodarchaeales archaeon]|jgi:effector-binding domain-containing protein